MGAWGYEPVENDYAFEWLASEVEAPLLGTIRRTLRAYLDQGEKDDVKTHEAEAAAALLVDLTGDRAKMKYLDLNCAWLAKGDDLWSLAAEVVHRIMQDEPWINAYNEPEQKRAVLQRLLADLKLCQGTAKAG